MQTPTVAAAIDAYLAELADEQVPLGAALSVAAVLADLCRHLDLPMPVEVAVALDVPAGRPVAAGVAAD